MFGGRDSTISSKQIVEDCYGSEYQGGLASAAQLIYTVLPPPAPSTEC